MSVNTIEKVKEIERQAEELERDYEKQLLELKDSTEKTIADMQKKLDSEVEKFKEKETAIKEDKVQSLKNSYQKEEQQQLDQLEINFTEKKEELVNKVVEEVMRKYGNS
ncbi:hypothetical protein ACS127_13480 [Amphibacillus sp. Q70]|uniref:hypothetical protein n=1 Tax=Amphibacillus sp. Q70 TaxID=3453416 RepID=UPI003F88022D